MMSGAVLIVDDEPSITASLSLMLDPWAQSNGLRILTAGSADQAEAVIARDDSGVCILLTDIRMPGRSGTDLVLKVKSEHPEVISMLVTGLSEVEEMTRAFQAGVFSYILKPWNLPHLLGELDRALDLFRLRERDRAHQQRIEEDLRWAAELQHALFAGRLPAAEGVRLSAYYRPLPEFGCGGDYCDVIPREDGSLLLLAGDVAGHGVRAALVASFLKALVGAAVRETTPVGKPPDLAALLQSLNERICSSLPDSLGVLVSLAVVCIQPGRREMSLASAGHPPALLVRARSPVFLPSTTLPLGAGPDSRFSASAHAFSEGDLLVLYTDGLVEVRGSSMETGAARLAEAAGALAEDGDPAQDLAERMTPPGGYTDDVTVLTARLAPRRPA